MRRLTRAMRAHKSVARAIARSCRPLQDMPESTRAPSPAGGIRAPRPTAISRALGLGFLALVAFGVTYLAVKAVGPRKNDWPAESPPGMVWIPGREFTMGSDAASARADEQPAHRVRVDGFWMDETEVTTDEFRKFVEATGYVTTAERKPEWEDLEKQLPPGTPKPDDDKLVPGSMVFTPTSELVPLDNHARWWRWQPGADWRHPEGPDSSLEGKENHPVIHVSWEDATAYAAWAGKQLPTEAQWELAARGGLEAKPFVWGSEVPANNPPRANIWQGPFPVKDFGRDGFTGTAPVKSYAPNGNGLYDMAGNVWEWVADWYRADTYKTRAGRLPVTNPSGPDDSFDPQEPYASKRVIRGGSFLCNDSYCSGYRPSARMKTDPFTGLSHTGFRCVVTPEMRRTGAAKSNNPSG